MGIRRSSGNVSGFGSQAYSKIVWPNDLLPTSPTTEDDEFDKVQAATTGSITGWTEQHSGTAATWEVKHGMLFVQAAAESGWALKTQTKALPGSGDWEYELAVKAGNAVSANYLKPAMLCLIEGTTSQKVKFIGQHQEAKLWVGYLASYTSYTSTQLGSPDVEFHDNDFYYRIEKSGTTFTWKASKDGDYFITAYSDGSLGFTPTKIGIGINVENTTYGLSGAFKHFRRIS